MVFKDLTLDESHVWFEPNDAVLLYIVLGLIIAFYGVSGRYLKYYLCISEPMSSMLIGFLLGGFFDLYGPVITPNEWFVMTTPRQFILQLARLTIAIQLMSTALRLPRFFVLTAWKQLLLLLVPVMFLTMLTSALFSWALFDSRYEGLGLVEALTVGAMFSPTDPVVAAAALSGKFATKRLSSGFRHLLSAESAANDGLAYLYFSLPLLFASKRNPGNVLTYYFAKVLGYEIVLAAIIALVLGVISGILVEFAETRLKTDKESFLAFTLGYAIFILGLLRLFDMDAIFSVFVAGCGLIATYPHHKLRHENSEVQNAVDSIVTCAFFFLLGVIFPFGEIYDLGWRGVVLSLLLIFFRRPLWIFLFYFFLRPYVRSFPGEGLLYSYFAPIGVSTVFYGALASESLRFFDREMSNFFWLISLEVVAFSTFIHGFTGVLFTHFISYFEEHKAPLYEAVHLPPPNPLRGLLELPCKGHMNQEEKDQFKKYGYDGSGNALRRSKRHSRRSGRSFTPFEEQEFPLNPWDPIIVEAVSRLPTCVAEERQAASNSEVELSIVLDGGESSPVATFSSKSKSHILHRPPPTAWKGSPLSAVPIELSPVTGVSSQWVSLPQGWKSRHSSHGTHQHESSDSDSSSSSNSSSTSESGNSSKTLKKSKEENRDLRHGILAGRPLVGILDSFPFGYCAGIRDSDSSV